MPKSSAVLRSTLTGVDVGNGVTVGGGAIVTVAVERLEVAAGRCRILEWEARLRALEEGGRLLCMARAECLREVIG